MKKVHIISMAAAAALMTFSCTKENNVIEESAAVESAVKSFIVEAPQTKTSIDGLSVKWAEGDEITVYGYTAESPVGKATFQLSSAPGSSTGTFTIKEGETMGEYDNYYAFYPASIATSFASGEIQVSSGINYDGQTAVEGGFDPKFALMTAKADAGTFTFRHAAAYFKVKVLEDSISEVKLTFGKNAAQKRPYFNAESGEISKNNGGTATLTSTGSFVKNSVYYIAAIPNSGNKMTSLELSMTKSGATSSISSSAAVFNSTMLVGHVYNLGAPVIDFSPVINADDPSKLANDATEGSFTFTVSNGDVSDVTVTKTTGDWITAFDAATVPGTVTFNCSANTGEERTATFTLSIAGGADVIVTVTQKAVGGGASEDYVWDFSSTDWTTELTSKGNSNTDITDWTSTVDGLTWYSKGKSKWNTRTISGTTYTYIQTGGAYSESNGRVFTFTVANAGTLTVTTTGTSSTADETRMCTVKVGDGTPESKAGGSAQDSLRELSFDIEAGDVSVYPTGNALRFFKIEFHSN